jgi:hypothetical protein
VTAKRWLVLVAAVLVLLAGSRMVLRYLDYQASQAAREAPSTARH